MRRPVLGIMGGGGDVSPGALAMAERLGALAARDGWVVLTGGRAAGIMEAAARGAAVAGGLVVGVLPTAGPAQGGASEHLGVAIYTGMGDARNVVNVLSSDVVVAFEGAEGTASEVALALRAGRPVVLLGFDDRGLFSKGSRAGQVSVASTPEEALAEARRLRRP